ncbi:MAG: FKBP-type peptidyl-prolyl cis-trans isomerase [Bacteroidales bacterium]|nr:FKBP-type peptidyl-prolyl cis-trans isomerase [Candidatus Cacconaster equifaecalis]
MKRTTAILIYACVAMLALSCARDAEEESPITYKRVMASWVKTHYPERLSDTTASGTYILEEIPGFGEKPQDSSFVFVHYTKYYLDGNIKSSNREEIARQLMQYEESGYYGCAIWQLGKGFIPVGIEEVLREMRLGGSVKIALPLSASTVDSLKYNLFTDRKDDDNYLYTLSLDGIEQDIVSFEERTMESFRDSLFPGLEPMKTGFYFKKLFEPLTEDTDDADTITDKSSVYVRYVARRLYDDKVFDTNIQDTAKKYGLYISGKGYNPLTITFYRDSSTMASENSMVAGFTYAVNRMKYNEVAVTFFDSDHGYGDKGSGTSVPEYAPLCFTIWTSKDND